MGRIREPRHPLEKRELLHRENPDARRIDAIAEEFLSTGRAGEAVDYIEVTCNPELIAELERVGKAASSPFLVAQAERLSGVKPDPADWIALAETCLASGRAIEAVRALTLAGEEARAEAIRLEHCPDYEPFRPLGK